jgi:hypothetical protein
MTTADAVTAQLDAELGAAARELAKIAPIARGGFTDQGICAFAEALSGDDPKLGLGAAVTVMLILRNHTDNPRPPEWWNTPVGRLVARWINPGPGSVTHDEAARMLGVTRGAVSQMVHRGVHGKGGSGGLERHPDGGVTRASVLARIARLSRTEQH